ncbi:MAG: hypothetical protein IPM85_15060 [Chitinophagaceae bacterium]|nr:hypothetical protein [Chitinophagaceae bacterium]
MKYQVQAVTSVFTLWWCVATAGCENHPVRSITPSISAEIHSCSLQRKKLFILFYKCKTANPQNAESDLKFLVPACLRGVFKNISSFTGAIMSHFLFMFVVLLPLSGSGSLSIVSANNDLPSLDNSELGGWFSLVTNLVSLF